MSKILVRIGRDYVPISRRVFIELMEGVSPYVTDAIVYKEALDSGKIGLKKLKGIALAASVPYPLFFAPLNIVVSQLNIFKKLLSSKYPSKTEVSLSHRGRLEPRLIQSILLDITRKQTFLKDHVLKFESENSYVGSLRIQEKKFGKNDEEIADYFRDFFEIDFGIFRAAKTKEKALQYLVDRFERKGIFVSYSSYNYMPQRITKDAGFSGLCVRDKYFPTVFLNLRDADENPLILETEGRQIFTLLSMLVSAGLGIFAIDSSGKVKKGSFLERINNIVGIILIPKNDLDSCSVSGMVDLKNLSQKFKVTPSMMLVRLRILNFVSFKIFKEFRDLLKSELNQVASFRKRPPSPVTGYAKYNGLRFSREVVKALRGSRITAEQAKAILFKNSSRMNNDLLSAYVDRFK